jgi:hypothetical protein
VPILPAFARLACRSACFQQPSTDLEPIMISHDEKKDASERLSAALMGFGAGVVWIAIVATISYQLAIHAH